MGGYSRLFYGPVVVAGGIIPYHPAALAFDYPGYVHSPNTVYDSEKE